MPAQAFSDMIPIEWTLEITKISRLHYGEYFAAVLIVYLLDMLFCETTDS